jgi:hypothetical protein
MLVIRYYHQTENKIQFLHGWYVLHSQTDSLNNLYMLQPITIPHFRVEHEVVKGSYGSHVGTDSSKVRAEVWDGLKWYDVHAKFQVNM